MSTFTFDLESLKGSAGSFGDSIGSGLSANTPDDKLTYSGNDPIIWDRINNERLRRGLAPLSNARPVDDGKTYPTGRGGTTSGSTSTGKPLTEEEKAKAAEIAKKFGLPDPTATAKTFQVNGPPGMTREEAYAIFQKQASAGGLTGFSSGDVLSTQTQAAAGLESAKAMLAQSKAGFPGTDQGTLNSFKSIADTAKQSLAAGTTGNLQSKISSGGSILQQTSAKIGSLFGVPPTNGINTADFAKTATAVMPMASLTTSGVRATLASIGTSVGQTFDQITNSTGVGKFGFNAPQLESAGLIKPGTASTFLSQGNNSLTSVLKSSAVWTGTGGITNLDSFLKNPAAQNLTQQNLMSSGLASAAAVGIPIGSLGVKDTAGLAANFSKSPADGTDWIKGQLPADKQADFNSKFKDAQFAIGSVDSSFNDAMLQQASPGEATNTVNRQTVDAATTRVVGNDKVPSFKYGAEDRDPVLAAERIQIKKEALALTTQYLEIKDSEIPVAQLDAKISQLVSIRSQLYTLYERQTILKSKALNGKPYSASFIVEIERSIEALYRFIDEINAVITELRRIRDTNNQ